MKISGLSLALSHKEKEIYYTFEGHTARIYYVKHDRDFAHFKLFVDGDHTKSPAMRMDEGIAFKLGDELVEVFCTYLGESSVRLCSRASKNVEILRGSVRQRRLRGLD